MTNKPSFFAELKRRNVYKVAIAYAVVGWLLIQIATQVFPFFEIPNWVVRLVVLSILLGFPIALVIAAALAVIATHNNEQYVPTFLLMLGEPERSFAEYEQSATGLSDAYLNFLWQPDAWSRKARQSPAFQGFAKRIGMLDYWKQNRWPDLCSPTPENGPDAFTCR